MNEYKIREICGDWALDIPICNEIVSLYFFSRVNAELVKDILEWEDAHPNQAVPYKPGITMLTEAIVDEIDSITWYTLNGGQMIEGDSRKTAWYKADDVLSITDKYRNQPDGEEALKDEGD